MALRWNLENISDYETVCFYEAGFDHPASFTKAGDRVMNPVTNVLIWATIAVDLGEITEKNAAEFFARLRYTEQQDGPFLIRAEVDGKRPEGEAAFVTEAEVLAHVGLSCNVANLSRAAWLNKVKHQLDRDLDSLADRFDRKVEESKAAA